MRPAQHSRCCATTFISRSLRQKHPCWQWPFLGNARSAAFIMNLYRQFEVLGIRLGICSKHVLGHWRCRRVSFGVQSVLVSNANKKHAHYCACNNACYQNIFSVFGAHCRRRPSAAGSLEVVAGQLAQPRLVSKRPSRITTQNRIPEPARRLLVCEISVSEWHSIFRSLGGTLIWHASPKGNVTSSVRRAPLSFQKNGADTCVISQRCDSAFFAPLRRSALRNIRTRTGEW